MSTGIEWTDETWNPTTGCDRVSEGCDNCYAASIAKRLWGMQYEPNPDGSPRRFEDVRMHPERLEDPLRWRKPRLVFVDSMSDLFHDAVPDGFIAQVFAVMAATPEHTYQVLTKRPGRMASLLRRTEFSERVEADAGFLTHGYSGAWPLPNVWLGTSVENQKWANVRIPKLLETPAAVRFLSCEPLLGRLNIEPWLHESTCFLLEDPNASQASCTCSEPRERSLDWVIAGGESGRGARPMHPGWVRELRDACRDAEVPFFFKQWRAWAPVEQADPDTDPKAILLTASGKSWKGWGQPMREVGKKAAGRQLDGRTWDEMPEAVNA